MGHHQREGHPLVGALFQMVIAASQEFPSVPASEQGRKETAQGKTRQRSGVRRAAEARGMTRTHEQGCRSARKRMSAA